MKAERLIKIMFLLQNNGKMTTQELSSRLDVSKRTILRDMDALSLSGIPVFAERGKMGGWRLIDSFRSSMSGMNMEDLKALFVLPSSKILEELGIHSNGLDIRQKLIASMPRMMKDSAQHFLEKIHMDSSTWKPSTFNTQVFNILQQALRHDKKVEIEYKKANREYSNRIVSPLGLVSKGSSWYLVALNEEGEYRNFRTSRIMRVAIRPEGFLRPENFNLENYWQQSKMNFTQSLPKFQIKGLVHSSIIARMTFTNKFLEIVEVSEEHIHDQMTQVVMNFNSEQEAIEYVLGFGNMVRLLQPAYLIEKIVQQAKSVIEMYE